LSLVLLALQMLLAVQALNEVLGGCRQTQQVCLRMPHPALKVHSLPAMKPCLPHFSLRNLQMKPPISLQRLSHVYCTVVCVPFRTSVPVCLCLLAALLHLQVPILRLLTLPAYVMEVTAASA